MKKKNVYIFGLIEKFVPQGIYLLTNILLAHFLTPNEFGAIGVLAIFIAIANTLCDSGLGGSLVKEKNLTSDDCSTVFVFNLSISIIAYLIIYLTANYIENFYKINGLAEITRWLSLILVINAFSMVPRSLLFKELKFSKLAFISIVSMIIAALCSFIGVALNWGSYSLIAFQIGNAVCSLIMFKLITKFKYIFRFSLRSFKKLFSFGLFTTICGFVDAIYENILSIILGINLGATVVGYYDQAKKLENGSAYSIVSALNNVSFPYLVKYVDSLNDFKAQANIILRGSIAIFFPMLGFIAIYSSFIVNLLFGEKWGPVTPFLTLLMVNGMIYIAESTLRNNIKSLGYVKYLANITIIKRLLGICIIIIFLTISPFSTLYGLILSTLIGFIINAKLYCKIINFNLLDFLKDLVQMLLYPISIIGVLILIHSFVFLEYQWLQLIAGIVAMILYYLLLLPRLIGFNLIYYLKTSR